MSTPTRASLTAGAPIVSATTFGFEFAGNYAFYDRNANVAIKPEYYKQILAGAKKIVIWDPHFMENEDGKLFESVNQNDVEIVILTVCTNSYQVQQEEPEVHKLRDNIRNALRKAGVSRFSGYVYAFKHHKVKDGMRCRIYQCHDRFWMIDDKDLYIVGASMNNQLSSEWNFGIMKIEKSVNPDIYKLVDDKYTALLNKFSANQNGWRAQIRP